MFLQFACAFANFIGFLALVFSFINLVQLVLIYWMILVFYLIFLFYFSCISVYKKSLVLVNNTE